MEKSNFNRILFPPSLWWSFFSLPQFNPPFSPRARPYTHFPFATLTHSLSYVQIPPSHSPAMAHKKSMRAFSLLCTSARYTKKRGFIKWNDIHQREGEQNHQELFLSNFLCVSFCCSWNDKWWKDIDMKKKVSFVVAVVREALTRTVEWLRNEKKSWKSPAREIRAREKEWNFGEGSTCSYAAFIFIFFFSADCSQLLHGNGHESMKTENLRPLLNTSGRCVWVKWKKKRSKLGLKYCNFFCIFSTSVKKVWEGST